MPTKRCCFRPSPPFQQSPTNEMVMFANYQHFCSNWGRSFHIKLWTLHNLRRSTQFPPKSLQNCSTRNLK
jgi:hypothetical protein